MQPIREFRSWKFKIVSPNSVFHFGKIKVRGYIRWDFEQAKSLSESIFNRQQQGASTKKEESAKSRKSRKRTK